MRFIFVQVLVIRSQSLARDAQAKLAPIVAQCLSIHLSICLCVCPRQLESRVCTQHCASQATSTTGLF